MGTLKERVQGFWDRQPCGTGDVDGLAPGTRAYFDEIERQRYAWNDHAPRVLNFADWAGKEVLEIGCGVGTDLRRFARAEAQVTGVDLSPESVRLARQAAEVYGLDADIQQADAESLSFPEGRFDLHALPSGASCGSATRAMRDKSSRSNRWVGACCAGSAVPSAGRMTRDLAADRTVGS